MALAALIAATRPAEGGDEGLRATLPVAGRSLIEHQAHSAKQAGATQVVLLVERLPASLAAAVERLRREGFAIHIARSIAEAADAVHPEDALLLFADGCIAGAELVSRVATARSPALLIVADSADPDAFERIDATTRWAGLALLDGVRLRQTAAMVGDWDLVSTLLRRAVQEGAARITAFPGAEAGADRDILLIATGPAALAGLDARLVRLHRSRGVDWPSRFLFPVVEELAAPTLVRSPVEPRWLGWGAVGVAALGALLALFGWRLPALAALLLAGPLRFAAGRLATARLGRLGDAREIGASYTLVALVALAGLARGLAAEGGWGAWPVAALVPLALGCATVDRRLLGVVGAPQPSPWLATVDGLAWALLPFALFGAWWSGLVALPLYALGSAAVLRHALFLRVAPV